MKRSFLTQLIPCFHDTKHFFILYTCIHTIYSMSTVYNHTVQYNKTTNKRKKQFGVIPQYRCQLNHVALFHHWIEEVLHLNVQMCAHITQIISFFSILSQPASHYHFKEGKQNRIFIFSWSFSGNLDDTTWNILDISYLVNVFRVERI